MSPAVNDGAVQHYICDVQPHSASLFSGKDLFLRGQSLGPVPGHPSHLNHSPKRAIAAVAVGSPHGQWRRSENAGLLKICHRVHLVYRRRLTLLAHPGRKGAHKSGRKVSALRGRHLGIGDVRNVKHPLTLVPPLPERYHQCLRYRIARQRAAAGKTQRPATDIA